jgi:nucleotidyltransferase substrate binding protein (TIGR01987 family)
VSDRALDNARRAMEQLRLYLAQPVVTDRDRAGVIHAFEFTFECVWRLLKRVSEEQGIPAPSPKKALSAAFRLGLIRDEKLWLDMLGDRNLTTHVYNPAVAAAIFEAVSQRYRDALSAAIDAAAKEST